MRQSRPPRRNSERAGKFDNPWTPPIQAPPFGETPQGALSRPDDRPAPGARTDFAAYIEKACYRGALRPVDRCGVDRVDPEFSQPHSRKSALRRPRLSPKHGEGPASTRGGRYSRRPIADALLCPSPSAGDHFVAGVSRRTCRAGLSSLSPTKTVCLSSPSSPQVRYVISPTSFGFIQWTFDSASVPPKRVLRGGATARGIFGVASGRAACAVSSRTFRSRPGPLRAGGCPACNSRAAKPQATFAIPQALSSQRSGIRRGEAFALDP
jgi:hypothetical protein